MTSILETAPALRYRAAAQAFVELIEGRGRTSPAEWLAQVHMRLPELYAAALALGEVEPATSEANPRAMSQEEWASVYADICGVLGKWNYYWLVFDPYIDSDREAVCGSVADDLADIYRDLRDGLENVKSVGKVRPNNVFWEWRSDFRSHWAAHATGALRALSTAFFVYHARELPESFGSEASISPIAS